MKGNKNGIVHILMYLLAFLVFFVMVIVLMFVFEKEKVIQVYDYELRSIDIDTSLYLCEEKNDCFWKKILWLEAKDWYIYLYTLYWSYIINWENNWERYNMIEDFDKLNDEEKEIFDKISEIPENCHHLTTDKKVDLHEKEYIYKCFYKNPNIFINENY